LARSFFFLSDYLEEDHGLGAPCIEGQTLLASFDNI
jgi:hypothetical protein